MTDPAKLSKRERQIMEVIYRLKQASTSDVVAGLEEPPSRTAVRTLLGILETKGHLKHRKEGREYIYSPKKPRRTAGRSMLRSVVHTFFDGSVEKALAAHFSDPQTRLSPEELERLSRLVEEAKHEGKSKDPTPSKS